MDFKKCSRCGNFYISNANVCPKCSTKESFEFSTFKSYIEENGLSESIDEISGKTGISVKNLNRFIEYNNKNDGNGNGEKFGNITELKTSNDGIQFLL